MLTSRRLFALVLCIVLAACASTSTVPDVPQRAGQALDVVTDPPGAACSIRQGGKFIASIAATPATVNVPRDFCSGPFCPAPETLAPLEVACGKDGYLEHRMTLPVAWTFEVYGDELTSHDVANFGMQTLGRGAAQVATVVAPPVGIGLMVAVLGADIAYLNEHPKYQYSYRPPPAIFLTPAVFESEAECDAYFASLKGRLESTRDAERARIDSQCRLWPCARSGPACLNPACERERARADTNLKTQLDEIPALRAQIRIDAKR